MIPSMCPEGETTSPTTQWERTSVAQLTKAQRTTGYAPDILEMQTDECSTGEDKIMEVQLCNMARLTWVPVSQVLSDVKACTPAFQGVGRNTHIKFVLMQNKPWIQTTESRLSATDIHIEVSAELQHTPKIPVW